MFGSSCCTCPCFNGWCDCICAKALCDTGNKTNSSNNNNDDTDNVSEISTRGDESGCKPRFNPFL
jgi:hypothetical protein